jgi:hypothetical protein
MNPLYFFYYLKKIDEHEAQHLPRKEERKKEIKTEREK